MASLRKPLRVLVVEDSVFAARIITQHIEAERSLSLMGTAPNPFEAARLMQHETPDVLVLDIEMPRMDGLTFLRHIMAQHPLPIIIFSSLTQRGTAAATQALALGAAAVLPKATGNSPQAWHESLDELMHALRLMASHRVNAAAVTQMASRPAHLPPVPRRPANYYRLLAIGASTGGPQAVEYLLTRLQSPLPPIVVAQHILTGFSDPLARRLNDLCPHLTIAEAQDTQPLLPNHVYIAPSGRHLETAPGPNGPAIRLSDGPKVNRHRPSIDVTMQSVARLFGRRAIGILLTGMGTDGAAGLLELHKTGGLTLAQDEASCVVYGMPKHAADIGAAAHILNLNAMPQYLAQCLGQATQG